MSAQHTQGRLVEDTRGPRADIRSESGRIVAVTYGLGFPKTAEGMEKRTQEDRANARRLVACWNACEGISTEALEQDDAPRKLREDRDMLLAQRDELLAALKRIKALDQPVNIVDTMDKTAREAVEIASAAIAKVTGTITPAERQFIDDKLREEYRAGFDGPPAD